MSGRQARKLRQHLRQTAPNGPLRMRVRNTPGGAVSLEYSRAAATVVMTPDEARTLGEALLRHADGGPDAAP